MDAVAFLNRDGVRSIKQCYINTNATCPECQAKVYFYTNRYGSRVFFDDLGPPWPKHPCTDNPRVSAAFKAIGVEPPKQRPRGKAIELVEAARNSRMAAGKIFGVRRQNEWTPAVIHSVQRNGKMNLIKFEYLDSTAINDYHDFICYSDDELISIGAIINIRYNEISFIHPISLRPTVAHYGGEISTVEDGYFSEVANAPVQSGGRISVDQVLIPRPDKHGKIPKLKRLKTKGVGKKLRGDLLTEEMDHFGRNADTVGKFLQKFDPIIRQYAREGTRKPRAVADRLRAEGRRTMAGAHWTPRLAFFLLKLVFNEKSSKQASHKTANSTQPAAAPATDSWIEKLARLGKVTSSRKTPQQN
jgi:hypothetical protein